MTNLNSYFNINNSNYSIKLDLLGNWNKTTLPPIIKKLTPTKILPSSKLVINFSSLEGCDSCAIIYIISFIKKFDSSKVTIENLGKFEPLYNLYSNYYINHMQKEKENSLTLPVKVGEKAIEVNDSIKDSFEFVGEIFFYFWVSLCNIKNIRFKIMTKHLEEAVINALFIIALTSFLVGVVIAYQSAVQLEKFGANIFIVEMICITMFREIAPLMTAIVIAGRTASSYTAEIGAMKITEEINAMKTMGFEPAIFLTLPRIFALVIGLPLLIFFSDIVSVAAGSVVAFIDLDIIFAEFIARMKDTVEIRHFFIGIFKGIFFGIAIAVIGCYRGFQVENNTTSIGKFTTKSVVNAIFVVIALNAIFSVILTQSGL